MTNQPDAVRCGDCHEYWTFGPAFTMSGETKGVWKGPKVKRRRHKDDPKPCQHPHEHVEALANGEWTQVTVSP